MNTVEIEGLCKKYPSFELKNVSFSIGEGRIVGFVGRNGAGKTTTVKSMLNLVHPDSGKIRYFGLPFAENEGKIKERIGYSTGTVGFYPRCKLKNIIQITKSFYSTWDDEACEKYRKLFELDENKSPIEMSEGMKVKCNLLIALSHKAELLILDEPTSGLDPFSRNELLDVLVYLKNQGVSILFSTHIISDIDKCADDLIYIKKGEIALSSSMEDFRREYCSDGKSVEDAILALEGGAFDA